MGTWNIFTANNRRTCAVIVGSILWPWRGGLGDWLTIDTVDMNRWSVQQLVACIKWYMKIKSVTIMQQNLSYTMCHSTIPSCLGLLNSEPGVQRTMSTPENREWVHTATFHSSRRSACSRIAALSMSDRTARQMLHKIKFHRYKITNVQEPNVNHKRQQSSAPVSWNCSRGTQQFTAIYSWVTRPTFI